MKTAALTLVLIGGCASAAFAQLRPPEVRGLRGAPFPSMNPPPDVRSFGEGPAWDGKPPDGVQPLPIDMFTSKDFYKDRALWMDQRYWRCNAPRQIADMRSGGAGSSTNDPRIGSNPPASARWGDCKMDWPRENIVSPYRFKTAKEHYEALLADAKSRGGPTRHTYATMPRWDGVYGEYAPDGRRVWNYSRANQVPTLLSLLTPEYQQRMVRQIYHEGVDAAHQWSASYCWPEGFMRQWATGPKPTRVVVTPEVVLFMGSGSGNMWRVVHLNREFPLGPDVRQWYGDTIGFWDGDALITWTANVQGWNQHSSWEWSDSLESIEILTPVRDAGWKVHRPRLGIGDLRFRGARRARADSVAQELPAGMGHGRAPRLGRMYPAALSSQWVRDSSCAGAGHRVPGPGHVQSPLGTDLGRVFREEHGKAQGNT